MRKQSISDHEMKALLIPEFSLLKFIANAKGTEDIINILFDVSIVDAITRIGRVPILYSILRYFHYTLASLFERLREGCV